MSHSTRHGRRVSTTSRQSSDSFFYLRRRYHDDDGDTPRAHEVKKCREILFTWRRDTALSRAQVSTRFRDRPTTPPPSTTALDLLDNILARSQLFQDDLLLCFITVYVITICRYTLSVYFSHFAHFGFGHHRTDVCEINICSRVIRFCTTFFAFFLTLQFCNRQTISDTFASKINRTNDVTDSYVGHSHHTAHRPVNVS